MRAFIVVRCQEAKSFMRRQTGGGLWLALALGVSLAFNLESLSLGAIMLLRIWGLFGQTAQESPGGCNHRSCLEVAECCPSGRTLLNGDGLDFGPQDWTQF